MWACLKRTDYFLTVSTYSSHLVMPFSHNQNVSVGGGNKSPYSLLSCSHLPLSWLTSPSLVHCTRWQEMFSIHFEQHKERGALHRSPTPYFISLKYKYTLWEMVQKRKPSPWERLVYSNTEFPSVDTDELAISTLFTCPLHACFPNLLKGVTLCTLVTLPLATGICLDSVRGKMQVSGSYCPWEQPGTMDGLELEMTPASSIPGWGRSTHTLCCSPPRGPEPK